MDTIYKERANGRWEYYTYVEGRACYVSVVWAQMQLAKGTVRIVTVA